MVGRRRVLDEEIDGGAAVPEIALQGAGDSAAGSGVVATLVFQY